MRSPGLEPAPIDPSLRDLPLRAFRPRSSMRVPAHAVERARFPVIDAHNHLGRWLTPDGDWSVRDVGVLLDDMDRENVAAIVNLDGMWGDELRANLGRYDEAHPGRFVTFAQPDWRTVTAPGWPERADAGHARRRRPRVRAGSRSGSRSASPSETSATRGCCRTTIDWHPSGTRPGSSACRS